MPDCTIKSSNPLSLSGNIRKLENRVKGTGIMADGKPITTQELELTETLESQHVTTLKEAREHLEREMILAVLRRHSGKITAAAQELGISRPTLYEMMEKLNITRE